jgi:hypothetical protein
MLSTHGEVSVKLVFFAKLASRVVAAGVAKAKFISLSK